MRSLVKLEIPEVLVRRKSDWVNAYISSGGKARPWAHDDIKEKLLQETMSKCAYCEAQVLSVDFGDVEHILPKKVFPQLVVDWDNLTLVCSRCNGQKGSKYDPDLEFINPYVDEIERHLLFLGAMAYDVSDRGLYTITELDLNNAHRVEGRLRAIQGVESLLRRADHASSKWVESRLQELVEVATEEGAYTAAVRSYLSARLLAMATT